MYLVWHKATEVCDSMRIKLTKAVNSSAILRYGRRLHLCVWASVCVYASGRARERRNWNEDREKSGTRSSLRHKSKKKKYIYIPLNFHPAKKKKSTRLFRAIFFYLLSVNSSLCLFPYLFVLKYLFTLSFLFLITFSIFPYHFLFSFSISRFFSLYFSFSFFTESPPRHFFLLVFYLSFSFF